MEGQTSTLVPEAPKQPASFSLSFAIPTRIHGIAILATAPGSDGTIGGPTRYQSGGDGVVKTDEQEDDDK